MNHRSPILKLFASILVLTLTLGMLPAGALRVYADSAESVTLGQWVTLESAEKETVYQRVSLDALAAFDNAGVTAQEQSKPLILGFGEEDFYALTRNGDALSVTATRVSASEKHEGFYTVEPAEGLSPWYYQASVMSGTVNGGFSTSWEAFSWGAEYTGTFLFPNVGWDGVLSFGSATPWLGLEMAQETDGSIRWTGTIGDVSEENVANGALAGGTKIVCGVKSGALTAYTAEEVAAEGFAADAVSLYIYAPVEMTETAVSYAALKSRSFTFDLAVGAESMLRQISDTSTLILSDDQTADENDVEQSLTAAGAACTPSSEINAAGEYTVSVSYQGKAMGQIALTVTDTPAETTEATEATETTEATENTEATEATGETTPELPIVGFDAASVAAQVQLDVYANSSVTLPLAYLWQLLPENTETSVTWHAELAEGLSGLTAQPNGDSLVITASAACEGDITLIIDSAIAGEDDAQVDAASGTLVIHVSAVDNSQETGVVTLEDDLLPLLCGQSAASLAVTQVKHGTYNVPADSWSISYTASGVSVDANGIVTAGTEATDDASVTVTVSYLYGEQTYTASASYTVKVVDAASDFSISIGEDYSEAMNNVIPAGTDITVVPDVNVGNWMSSYTIRWSVSNGAASVAQTVTYGGPLEVKANGIQPIGNGVATVHTNSAGTVTLTATLVEVNGLPVFGVSDSISITVVAADDGQKLSESVLYDRDDLLYGREGVQDEKTREYTYPAATDYYEFRIKDLHTFQKEEYGLDARVIAVQGDRRIDFSQVSLYLYKNGQLALNEAGQPIEIPASELSFYDVDTEQVGWVQIRVTYKDYYKGYIASGNADYVLFEEYTTGVGGTDGYIWMYVREAMVETETVTQDGTTVSLRIEDLRPWMGVGHRLSTENQAWYPVLGETREGMFLDYGELLYDVKVTVSQGEDSYTFENSSNSNGVTLEDWGWWLEGALQYENPSNSYDNSKYLASNFTTKTAEEIGVLPALGKFFFRINSVKINGTGQVITLEQPLVMEVPIVVRPNSVGAPVNEITFGYTPQWGSNEGFAYGSFLGGQAISSYAISYVSDLESKLYEIGLKAVPEATVGSGTWHEYFAVNAPMGTSDVKSYFHSYTDSDSIVYILEPEERESESAEYSVEVSPQLVILDANCGDTGTIKATIRDLEGNIITTDAKVKWTVRNTTYATADAAEVNGGMQTVSGGVSDDVTVTGMAPGVTFVTAQLMSVFVPNEWGGTWKDVEKQYIADYAIIYVVDKSYVSGSMSVVLDYGKPVNVDLDEMIASEAGYELIGFSDLEHSLRKMAYTNYGRIEIGDGDIATYYPSQILGGIDQVYVIFQHVTEEGTYYWHHHVLNIIPATVTYYETDGAVGSSFRYDSGYWSVVNVNGEAVGKDTFQQSHAYDSVSHNEIYGYDANYANDAYLSDGTSLYAEGTDNAQTVKVSFRFTGTGFDIISRTGAQQGDIKVTITPVDGTEGEVRTVSVINKGNSELYQIPVLSVKDLAYGTYEVTVGVYQGVDYPTIFDALDRGNQFYFDAVRIYNTVDANASGIAKNAYMADGEYAPVIYEIGKLLVNANTFNAAGDRSVSGILYLDDGVDYEVSDDTITTYHRPGGHWPGCGHWPGDDQSGYENVVQTYDKIGPNHEVYLAEGQGIAFALQLTDLTDLASIQIGAKSVTGQEAALNANIQNMDDAVVANCVNEDISSATAMYYELMYNSDYTASEIFAVDQEGQYTAYIVVKNAGKGILSVTDLKVAFTGTPVEVTILVNPLLARAAVQNLLPELDSMDGLYKSENGTWYYCTNGAADTSYTGLAENQYGLWYVSGGQIDFGYTGLAEQDGETYYIWKGSVKTSVNGLEKVDGQWLYFVGGKVDKTYTGLVANRYGTWYVTGGAIAFETNGFVRCSEGFAYVRNGMLAESCVGLYKTEAGQWVYVVNGIVDDSYTGIAKNSVGWWYVVNGKIDFGYTGIIETESGICTVYKGSVDCITMQSI